MSWYIRMEEVLRPDGPERWRVRLGREMQRRVDERERPVVIDAGCGTKAHVPLSVERPRGVRIGLDIDPSSAGNPDIDFFVRGSAEQLPFRSGCADLLVSSYVVEHLPRPALALAEFGRVLKPGAHAFVWTSNRLNYAMIASTLTPTAFHNWVRRLGDPTLPRDNMPTPYRANLPGSFRRAIERGGLRLDGGLQYGAGAYLYFCFSKPLFVLAALASRLARATPLRRLQAVLIAHCVKE